jgi:uncharacterized membrane protein
MKQKTEINNEENLRKVLHRKGLALVILGIVFTTLLHPLKGAGITFLVFGAAFLFKSHKTQKKLK